MLLYKYRGLSNFRFVADILCLQRLYCAPYAQLNDPFEGFFYFESRELEPCGDYERLFERCEVSELIRGDASALRVCCLSSDPWEVRLWALYAESCRGIAVEIDFPDDVQQLHPVHYETKLPTYLVSRDDLAAHEPLIHKTDVWQYESEYRIITDREFWDVSGRIRRVIVGPRCSPDDRLLLARLAPKGVELVIAEASDTWQAVVSRLASGYVKTHGFPKSCH